MHHHPSHRVDEHAPVSDDEEAEHAPDTSEDDSEEEDVEQVKATTQVWCVHVVGVGSVSNAQLCSTHPESW